jgi:hypothetical protein
MPLNAAQNDDPRTIHVRQGATWRGTFTWTQPVDPPTDPATYEPVDVTGYTARFRWLTKAGGTVLLTVVSPDTDDGGIAIDPETAAFAVNLCAEDTALLTKDGVYELDAVSATNPCEVVEISAGYANLILAGEPYPYPAVT